MSPPPGPAVRDLMLDLYRAATGAAAPGPALTARLQELELDPAQPGLDPRAGEGGPAHGDHGGGGAPLPGLEPAGGLVVAPSEASKPSSPSPSLIKGDHPEPGPGSLAAAEALGAIAGRVGPADEVWVLLSGGTTSLIGAPEPGITPADLTAIYTLLLGSGLDITAMNRIRKRFSRWGGGKLARALAPARVRVYIVSDVIGDDLAVDRLRALRPRPHVGLGRSGRSSKVPGSGPGSPSLPADLVSSAVAGKTPETPKPGDQAFARVTLELVASNRLALEAAAKRAAELGLAPRVVETPLAGEASTAGASVAASLLNNCVRLSIPQPSRSPVCLIWGGETTVTLGERPTGVGGRSQELALAAARELDGATNGIALLAAGTDGRDGPTDAAGAVVDGATWAGIRARGRDPARDLAAHDAYPALDAVGALIKPGLTGTNVMDIVIGICG